MSAPHVAGVVSGLASTADSSTLTVHLPGLERTTSPIEAWGIDLIRDLQAFGGPAVESFFKVFTLFGEFEFFVFLALMAMWAVDYRLGLRIMGIMLFSGAVNSFLKAAILSPRPYNFDPTLGVVGGTGGGMPSGHAQNAVAGWGAVASWFVERGRSLAAGRPEVGGPEGDEPEHGGHEHGGQLPSRTKRMIIIAVALTVLLVGLSRVWLGAHFPHDVLVGWLAGGVILLGYFGLKDPVSAWWSRTAQHWRLVLAVLAPLPLAFLPGTDGGAESAVALSGVAMGATLLLARRSGWETGSADPVGKDRPVRPEGFDEKKRHIPSAPETGAIRLLVGIFGLVIIGAGYAFLLPMLLAQGDTALRLAGSWLSGLWASYGAFAALPPRISPGAND